MGLNCPGCGSNLNIILGSVSLVCPYCKTILLVERGNLVNTGEKSSIMPFPTVFEVGKYFYAVADATSNDIIAGKKVLYIGEQEYSETKKENFLAKFYVYAQIRYASDGGFWDDFFVRVIDDNLSFDKNREYILGENEGLISLYTIKKIHTDVLQNVFDTQVGSTWNGYFIQESGQTHIEGFEGNFPFQVSTKDISKYVTLLKNGKTSALKSIGNDVLELSGV